jgi:hypothetical protein
VLDLEKRAAVEQQVTHRSTPKALTNATENTPTTSMRLSMASTDLTT